MTAHVPFAGLAPHEAQALRALGPRWADDIEGNRRQVVDIYTPHLARTSRAGIEVDADLAYGDHPRQRLDLVRSAATPRQGAPLAVFVHGGAFIRGNRNSNAEIYGNVTRWLARQGWLAANAGYRLAPEAPYPEGARDVARALAWLRRHAQAIGADPDRIVLVGHSAGGAHAAACALDPMLDAEGGQDGLAGLVLVSARLRADTRPHNPNAHGVRAYWGDDARRYDAVSPVSYAHRLRIPALVAVAEHENPYLDAYGAEFLHRALEAGVPDVHFIKVPGHNHTSIVAHLDTEDQSFAPALAAFLAGVRSKHSTSNKETA